jgi:hypothetical protein
VTDGDVYSLELQLRLLREIRDAANDIMKEAIAEGNSWYANRAGVIREAVRVLLPD